MFLDSRSVDFEPFLSFCSQSQSSHALHVNRANRKARSTTTENSENRPRPRANVRLQETRKLHETCSERLLAFAKITHDVTLIPEGRLAKITLDGALIPEGRPLLPELGYRAGIFPRRPLSVTDLRPRTELG